jgi:hypothetical protein
MTSPDGMTPTALETRLSEAVAAGDDQAVLAAVAEAEMVVPQTSAEGSAPEGSLTLPVIEQEGRQFVPVFTSQAAMTAAAPDVSESVTMPSTQLVAGWPTEELWMAVNPGSASAVALPPDVVRSLPSFTAG